MKKILVASILLATAHSVCADDAMRNVPLKTIGMSRTLNGWGAGQAFDLQLRADGTAFLSVHTRGAGGLKTQRSRGAFAKSRFAQIAAQMREKGFFDLQKHYSVSSTEQATTTLRVAGREYSREVSSYGDGAPQNFRDLVAVLGATRSEVLWRAIKPVAAKRR
jgi:hypothetical protein